MGPASLAAARPPTRLPAWTLGPWRQYPSSQEGWGVKNYLVNAKNAEITNEVAMYIFNAVAAYKP